MLQMELATLVYVLYNRIVNSNKWQFKSRLYEHNTKFFLLPTIDMYAQVQGNFYNIGLTVPKESMMKQNIR
jgi:hypothetical protein